MRRNDTFTIPQNCPRGYFYSHLRPGGAGLYRMLSTPTEPQFRSQFPPIFLSKRTRIMKNTKKKRDLLKHFEFSGEASVWTAMRERAGSKERLPLWTKWVLMPCRCSLPRRSPPWFGRVGKSLVASPLRLLRWKCIAICPCNSLKKISRLLTARRLNEVGMASSSQWLCLPFHNLTHPSSPDEAIMVPVIFQLTLHTVEP